MHGLETIIKLNKGASEANKEPPVKDLDDSLAPGECAVCGVAGGCPECRGDEAAREVVVLL